MVSAVPEAGTGAVRCVLEDESVLVVARRRRWVGVDGLPICASVGLSARAG